MGNCRKRTGNGIRNMGETSATELHLREMPLPEEDIFNGEYLINAQRRRRGCGIRTPQQITIEGSRRWAALQGYIGRRTCKQISFTGRSDACFAKDLIETQQKLEDYFKDMQDLEFTIQDGRVMVIANP